GALADGAGPAEPADPTNLAAAPDPTVAGAVIDIDLDSDDDAEVLPDPDADLTPRARRKAERARAKREQRASREAAAIAVERGEAEPQRRRRWPWVLLSMLIAAGVAVGTAYAITELRTPPSYPVLDYLRTPIEELGPLVEEFGWTVVPVEVRRTGEAVGVVLSQDPAPGTEMEEGPDSVLTVTYSVGNALAPVPTDLERMPQGEAEAAIVAAGFVVGEVVPGHDEEVESGLVLSFSHDEPVEEGKLPEGSAISLTISHGPQPRHVPGVASGSTYDEVAFELESLGLVPEQATEASESVPEGQVIRTEPAEGAEVLRDSTVRVVVSSGLPFVTVPDVEGMSEKDAVAELRAAGFGIGDRIGPPRRSVLATDPLAGESVRKGTEITIITRSTGSRD
ncbi:MAG: PASTA domain-containing protein, partial [Acidimicrobiia bacterium]|nr:PASTA domain-containing protein [Acidimicrobiia bacterium]